MCVLLGIETSFFGKWEVLGPLREVEMDNKSLSNRRMN